MISLYNYEYIYLDLFACFKVDSYFLEVGHSKATYLFCMQASTSNPLP